MNVRKAFRTGGILTVLVGGYVFLALPAAAQSLGSGTITDPTLGNIKAFTVAIPAGWKFQGTVVLYVEVGPEGLPHNIQVQRSLGLGLDEKAIEAVSQWRFQPGMRNGVPVTVAATIEVNFRLM